MSIPKVIHYCWFGRVKKPQLVEDCIASWKIYLPHYKIIEWNEKNSDLTHPFLRKTYALKKWAFVSDFIRLKVLYEFGGIYLDTDMLMIKSLDSFLEDNCFLGAENERYLSGAIIGTVPNHPYIKDCLLKYDDITSNNLTNWETICIPRILTQVLDKKYRNDLIFNKKIELNDLVIYPPPYFYPMNFRERVDIANYKKYLTADSFTIHLWNSSWMEPNEFHYLRNREYYTGLKKAFNNIKIHRKISFFYFRKILSAVKESFFIAILITS